MSALVESVTDPVHLALSTRGALVIALLGCTAPIAPTAYGSVSSVDSEIPTEADASTGQGTIKAAVADVSAEAYLRRRFHPLFSAK